MIASKPVLSAGLALLLFFPTSASADFIIWLDYDAPGWEFDVDPFPSCSSETAVREAIVAEVARDFAEFNVIVTDQEPASDALRRLHVKVGGNHPDFLGYAWDDDTDEYFHGAWKTVQESVAHVYSDRLSYVAAFQGSNSTCANVAQGLANVVSHEAGHVLWLWHMHALNGCPTTVTGSSHPDRLMTTEGWPTYGDHDDLVNNRYFSPRCSTPVLQSELKQRAYYNGMPDPAGNAGWTDLLKEDITGKYSMPTTMHRSDGVDLNPAGVLKGDVADPFNYTLVGDITGDGRDDYMVGRLYGSSVRWYSYESVGNSSFTYLGSMLFGEYGDLFRMADIDGDGDADLVRGSLYLPPYDVLTWTMKPRTSTSWGNESTIHSYAGDRDNLIFFTDTTGDGKDDLVLVRTGAGSISTLDEQRRISPQCIAEVFPQDPPYYVNLESTACQASGPPAAVSVRVHPSNGTTLNSFMDVTSSSGTLAYRTELVMFGRVNNNPRMDMIVGHNDTTQAVPWDAYYSISSGTAFSTRVTMSSSGRGQVGDLFRVGDLDGDGLLDLYQMEEPNVNTHKWHIHFGNGASFTTNYVILSDSGEDGMRYP